jgi:hypothetical protein
MMTTLRRNSGCKYLSITMSFLKMHKPEIKVRLIFGGAQNLEQAPSKFQTGPNEQNMSLKRDRHNNG